MQYIYILFSCLVCWYVGKLKVFGSAFFFFLSKYILKQIFIKMCITHAHTSIYSEYKLKVIILFTEIALSHYKFV